MSFTFPTIPAEDGFLIHTSDIPTAALIDRAHPLDSAKHRLTVSLGDSTGLTKTGIHLVRLPAGDVSSAVHWHSYVDEWFYIIDAGEGGVALVHDKKPDGGEGDSEAQGIVREMPLKAGDFLGFKGGDALGHSFRAGSKDMVYLVGGSRGGYDVTHYSVDGKKIEFDPDVPFTGFKIEDDSL